MRRCYTVLAILCACLVCDAFAGDQRMRYAFDGKKSGNAGVPHEIFRGELSDMENPFAPKAKEVDDASYKSVGESEDGNASADVKAAPKARAAFLIVFKVEKEVLANLKAWKSLEVEVNAVGGVEGEEKGGQIAVESYKADKKTWGPLENDLPEGAAHHFKIAAPLPPLVDREGRIAFRVSCTVADKPNRLALDFARLTLMMEAAGNGDSLTYSSVAGRCKLTRPDDPLWRFEESDKWFIRLVKGDNQAVDITINRYDSDSNYKFDEKSIGGGDTKNLAEAILDSVATTVKAKDKPKIKKGQVGAFKTQEFVLMGEAKTDGALMEIREIFISKKGNTYRISVWGKQQTMKEDRFNVDRALKTFEITD